MWCHRRNAASRTASGTHIVNEPMQEPSVERWLAEQNANSDPEQYAQDTWYVFIPQVPTPTPILGRWGSMM